MSKKREDNLPLSAQAIREKHLYVEGLKVNTGEIGQKITRASLAAMEEYAQQQVNLALKKAQNKINMLLKAGDALAKQLEDDIAFIAIAEAICEWDHVKFEVKLN